LQAARSVITSHQVGYRTQPLLVILTVTRAWIRIHHVHITLLL